MSLGTSKIFAVLGLLTPEELHALAGFKTKKASVGLKKAAGAEGSFWEEWEEEKPEVMARVLEFPQRAPEEQTQDQKPKWSETLATPLEEVGIIPEAKLKEMKKAAQEAYERSRPDTLEFMLAERDKFRDSEERIYQQTGLASYQKNSDLMLYRVKVKDDKGHEKSKLTTTQGVLVNRKQS